MKSNHPFFRRLSWHPVIVVIPLGLVISSISMRGFTGLRTCALLFVALWFLMSLYDLVTKHKLLDWMYGEEG